MIKVRVMNEYQIDEMLKSDIDINYDNFYKEQLIDMLKVCRDRYKKELKIKHEAKEYLETATIDPQSMRYYRDCLLTILEESVDNG